MGMDLQPVAPTAEAPRNEQGEVIWGRYNIAGWSWLIDHLQEWGVDVSEFSGCNDGDLISAKTCFLVGEAIEARLDELDLGDKNWLASHVALWKTCGGYYQF